MNLHPEGAQAHQQAACIHHAHQTFAFQRLVSNNIALHVVVLVAVALSEDSQAAPPLASPHDVFLCDNAEVGPRPVSFPHHRREARNAMRTLNELVDGSDPRMVEQREPSLLPLRRLHRDARHQDAKEERRATQRQPPSDAPDLNHDMPDLLVPHPVFRD